MTLPKLNIITYELDLPSTGETLQFRPFLVKEQKALLIAQESEDNKLIEKTFAQIINDCIVEDVDPYIMPMFDIEYVFLRIRGKSVGEKNFNTVDVGFGDGDQEIEMPLHSEASYSPSWPEIIWFFCVTPSNQGGETTLCDGIKLWKNLSSNTKNFFLSNPICFDLEFPILEKRLGKGKRPWMLNSQGSSDGYIDWDTGKFYVKQTRFAVHETRHPEVLAFSNHLMVIPGQDPQIKKWTTVKGDSIPSDIMDEIKSKSSELTYDHKWKKGDLVMIDNKRFMHGRRAFEKGIERDIVIVQTERASFGYGSTTRKQIKG